MFSLRLVLDLDVKLILHKLNCFWYALLFPQ